MLLFNYSGVLRSDVCLPGPMATLENVSGHNKLLTGTLNALMLRLDSKPVHCCQAVAAVQALRNLLISKSAEVDLVGDAPKGDPFQSAGRRPADPPYSCINIWGT